MTEGHRQDGKDIDGWAARSNSGEMIPLALLPGMSEWVLIGLAALLLFGPGRLPGLMRSLGRILGEFRKARSEVEREINRVMADPPPETRPAPEGTQPVLPVHGPAAISVADRGVEDQAGRAEKESGV